VGTNEYLKTIRRRWRVVAGAVVLAILLAGAYLVVRGGPAPQPYSATTVLWNTDQISDPGSTSGINVSTLAALVTVGKVPIRVARTTHLGTPQALAAMVEATGDPLTGLLRITVTSTDPDKAVVLSGAFANALLDYLRTQQDQVAAELTSEVNALQTQMADLSKRLQNASPSDAALLNQQLTAAGTQLALKSTELDRIVGAAGGTGLDIVQPPVAQRVRLSPLRVPSSPVGMLMVAAILGLLGGIAIALILERFDAKIRTKEAAERAFGYPVLAEIPAMSPARRRDPVFEAADSPTTDSFRLLGTGLLPRFDRRASNGDRGGVHAESGNGSGPRTDARIDRGGTAIMVTSADASEGKTTVVANLAAVFAEVGKRVLVLSCDFRRPAIHELLGVHEGPGMTQAMAAANGRPMLERHIRETRLDHVSIVTTGVGREGTPRPSSPDRLSRAIDEARSYADVVLLDSAPVLVGSEAPELVGSVDSVLLVARAGKTDPDLAERAADVLRRLDAPVAGIALNGSREAVVPHVYYRSHRNDGVMA
jgi:Mrp family chromosome partitioning ATPase/capsular polysaccharide biosynthesis protein